MRLLVLVLSFMFAETSSANDELDILATVHTHFSLMKNGFEETKLFDQWNIKVNGGEYFLLFGGKAIPLEIIKEDKNIIILRQPAQYSGFRIFSFFKKSQKVFINETGYGSLPEDAIKQGYLSESTTLSYGEYKRY